MRLASHNTFTYLPVRRWWMAPFAWMAKCQRVDAWEQKKLGADMFDLRVRFDCKKPVICHGLVEYRHADDFISTWLTLLNSIGGYYVRVTLELSGADKMQETGFYFFCLNLERDYPNVKFFGGSNRDDWECMTPIYHFKERMPDIDHRYSSTTTLFPKGPRWLKRIDDLCPFLYSLAYNERNVREGTRHEWMMIDFVDIQ